MTNDERLLEAQNIVDDICDEHGDLAPFHTISLEDAIETVSTYGHEGEDLEEISKLVVSLMEGMI